MLPEIYLCSASPRRQELLKLTGIDFQVRPLKDMDEDALVSGYNGDVVKLAEFLALEKSKLAEREMSSGIFITADTIVVSDDGLVLGKPRSDHEAETFLDRLSGNWHTVATGVVISESASGRIMKHLEITRVKFAQMTPEEIEWYISTGEPFDKAGGYGIQGRASIFIERIDGCYFNVVGFPLHSFWQMWKGFIA